MTDLADQIDDFICTFDSVGDLTMDSIAMLLFAWAVLALFLLWLCKFLYYKYVKKSNNVAGVVDSSKFGISPSEKLRKPEVKELSTSKDIKVSTFDFPPFSPVRFLFLSPRKAAGEFSLSLRQNQKTHNKTRQKPATRN